MPQRAPTPCSYFGCRAHAVSGGRCAEHQRKKRKKPRPNTTDRGYLGRSKWERLRKKILRRDNYCCIPCLKRWGRITAAVNVDHIQPLSDGGTNDEDNLQSICKTCHDEKTANEVKQGKDRRAQGSRTRELDSYSDEGGDTG